MLKPTHATTPRSRKGLQTRERLLGAAVAEFKREGMAGADTAAIASAASVAHGTFFFHFPTKEHVLLELELREEKRMADDLSRFFAAPHDVRGTLAECVRVLEKLERRLGPRLFKDFLALHFSISRLPVDAWTNHPVLVTVVGELQRAKDDGEIPAEVDAMHNGVSFLIGLYALLITMPDASEVRTSAIAEYLRTYGFGLRLDGLGSG